MTDLPDDVVIVGASVAGVSTADSLRNAGFQGRIRLIDAEDVEPYDKPPLSKQCLGPTGALHPVALRKPEHYEARRIELELGRRVVGFDAASRTLRFDDGEQLSAGAVVIATGARPRMLSVGDLPGDRLAGVYVVRSLADAAAIRDELAAGPRLVVIGGGFIGLEVASSARTRGLDVTVIEMAARPLAAALGDAPGAAMTAMHRDEGVQFVTGIGVDRLEGSGRVERVRLADGRTLPADLVVLGLGVVPAVDWLRGSGVDSSAGIVCDCYGRTARPGVYAAGDAASWADLRTGKPVRIEHWTTAQQHGVALGRTIADPDTPQLPPSVPYFWTDQFGVRLQSLGNLRGADEIVLKEGGWNTRDFVALYRKDDRLVGAVGANAARALMPYRALIERGEKWHAALAAFPSLEPSA